MQNSGTATTVLIVDDEDDLADSIATLLEHDGHRTVRARDGVHALELLEAWTPELILLDMNMPRLDGFGVLAALAKRGRPCPIVAMSAFPVMLPKAIALGATHTLRKPFELEELRAAVRSARQGIVAAAPPPADATPLAPLALFEDERVQKLQCLRVMEQATDACLDHLVRTTAELMRTPMALVSIITEDRQWWKAMHGMPPALMAARGTPRDHSFCVHAVAARAPLVVHDAKAHPVFADNEMVKQRVLNAYAGVPIVVDGIGALGTLCVLDREARTFSAADLQLLGLLAARVAAEIEWRERPRMPDRPLGSFKYLSYVDEKHEIYNASAFRALVTTLSRIALLEESTFGLVAFAWPHAGAWSWPWSHGDASVAVAVAALRNIAGGRLIVGWLEDGAIAALLPNATDETLRSVLAAAVPEEQRLRRARADAAALASPIAVAELVRGSLHGDAALKAVGARLRRVGER